MDLLNLLTIFVTLQTWCISDGQTLNDSETLIRDILNNHDIKSRPLLDQSQPIVINMSFAISSLMELAEVDGKFLFGGVVYVSWIDETKQWHPEQYGGIVSELLPYDKLWHPTIALVSVYEEVESFLKEVKRVKVHYNGFVTLYAPAVFKSRCEIDVTFYPFDTQNCIVYFTSQDYTPSGLILQTEFPEVPRSFYMEHGEWTLESTAGISGVFYTRDDAPLTYIQYDFKFKRNSNFYVMNTIAPITMMIVLQTFVFLLPPESGERVSYAITVLLAIAVFLSIISNSLPQTSNPVPIISYFIVVALSISTSMCAFAILNLRLFFKPGKPPVYLSRLTNIFRCCLPKSKENGVSKRKHILSASSFTIDNGTNNNAIMMEDDKELVHVCSWKHIGTFVDRICSVVFVLLITGITLLFLIILGTNNDVFGMSRGILIPAQKQ